MSKYARGTKVPVGRSESEVKQTLVRYGADDVVTGSSSRQRRAFVQFHFRGFPIQVNVSLPDPASPTYARTLKRGSARDSSAAMQLWERDCRQQWRVLLLLIKANLEAVENGILKTEEVFLPWLMLPDGSTVGQRVCPGIPAALQSGKIKALPFPGTEKEAAG